MTHRASNLFVVTLVFALALLFAIAFPGLSFAQSNASSMQNTSMQNGTMPAMQGGATTASMSADASASLYKRLGGYDALTAVTDDFITRLATDPKLGRFFTGLSDDSKGKVKAHVVDFLCKATGGPCAYTGRDMKVVHTGLHITEDDWNISVKHLGETFDKFNVGQRERAEMVQALGGLKADIVGR
jgi:hemoglobin